MIHIRMSDLDNSARPCLSGASERDERALYSHAGSTCELDLEIIVFIQDAHPVSDETLPGFLFVPQSIAGPVNLSVWQITG